MSESRRFWLKAQSPGGHWARTGCLALGIVVLSVVATSVLDTLHLSQWYERAPLVLLFITLEIFGVVSIVIGCAKLIGEQS